MPETPAGTPEHPLTTHGTPPSAPMPGSGEAGAPELPKLRAFIRAPIGTPPTLTKELHDQIVLLIQGGNYIETAGATSGVHRGQLFDWLRRGAKEMKRMRKAKTAASKEMRERERIYVEFNAAVRQAVALAVATDVLRMNAAAAKDWRAAAWRLERRAPKLWGATAKIDATVGNRPGETLVVESVRHVVLHLPDNRRMLRPEQRRALMSGEAEAHTTNGGDPAQGNGQG